MKFRLIIKFLTIFYYKYLITVTSPQIGSEIILSRFDK